MMKLSKKQLLLIACSALALILCVILLLAAAGVFRRDAADPSAPDGGPASSGTSSAMLGAKAGAPPNSGETEDLVYSPLNGLPIAKEDALLRPIAVVINNIYVSLPQSGISEADILYEVLAEGDITRFVAVFHKPQAEKIGSVRSVRDYFVDFLLDYDSILVHHGGSDAGYSRINNLKVDHLDGMKLEGTAFWRDPDRVRQRGMYEHSSYTSAERIEEAIAKQNIRREWNEGTEYGFLFNQDPLPFAEIAKENGGDYRESTEISVPFSRNYTRRFSYRSDQQQYAVFNRDGPHIDEGLGSGKNAQLYVSNIIVQFVNMHIIPGDIAGRREVATTGSGTGLLFSEGGCTAISWERESHASPTRWFFENGQPIQLKPGTTWICVLQKGVEVGMDGSPQQ
ncbi:MAG: DUF3048 domain-containing protein [Clostridiales bacterium]|nr:DUF3048 domain-containing protein [Clostridiales bacterium]